MKLHNWRKYGRNALLLAWILALVLVPLSGTIQNGSVSIEQNEAKAATVAMVLFDTAIDVTPGLTTTWTETDVSGNGVPAGATAVIIERVGARAAGASKVGARHPSSATAWQDKQDIYYTFHSYEIIPITGQKVDLYTEHETVGAIYLHGYCGDAFVATIDGNSDPKDYSEAGSFAAWVTDIDISGDVAVGAVAAVFWLTGTAKLHASVRDPGSTDNRITRSDITGNGMINMVVGCTGRLFDGYAETAGSDRYLAGYFISPADFSVNAADISLGTAGAWQEDVDESGNTAATANGMVFEAYNNSSTPYTNQGRQPGSVDNRVTLAGIGAGGHASIICGMDSGTYDGYINNLSSDSYVTVWSVPAGVSLPTVTTQAATSVEDTTATGNGNITATGGENCDKRGMVWDLATQGAPGNVAPGASGYANEEHADGSFGTGAYTTALTGLPTGDTIYVRAWAHNSAGYAYGAEINFLTKPAAPTNVAATDGAHETKVVITWTKSTGATDYHVWRDAVDLGAAGDVATFDDNGATAGTITNAGTVTSSDGTSPLHVTLSLAGEATGTTSHSYKVVASNASGDSDDSTPNSGYRGVGAITYQWQDNDGGWANIAGGTTDPYNYTGAGAPTITPGAATASDGTSAAHVVLSIAGDVGNNGTTWNYRCIISSTNASNSPQTSTEDTGYRGIDTLTYAWQRSAADADAAYGSIVGEGGTTDPYNDTNGVVDPDGRWYYCEVSMTGAATQDTTHNRGYKSAAAAPTVTNSIEDTIVDTTTDLIGNITGLGGGGNAICRGFVWDTVSRGDPGVAPSASAYAGSWEEAGSFGTGEFIHEITGLTELTVYYFRAAAEDSVAGWGYSGELEFFVGEEGKIYRGIRPDLDETLIRGNAGIPTDSIIGNVFWGYSLPIWSDPANVNEQLQFQLNSPEWWDGESDIIIHIHIATSGDEDGNAYGIQLTHNHSTPNVVEAFPAAGDVNLTENRLVDSALTYAHYLDTFPLAYDHDPADPIVSDDILGFRIRRIANELQENELDGELIIVNVEVYFAESAVDIDEAIDELIEDGTLIGGESVALYMLVYWFMALGLLALFIWSRWAIVGFGAALCWIIGGFYFMSQSPSGLDPTTALGGTALFMMLFGGLIFFFPSIYKPKIEDEKHDITLDDFDEAEKENDNIWKQSHVPGFRSHSRRPRKP